jgi:hypothetical protein
MGCSSSLDFIGPEQAIVYALVIESDPNKVISYKYVGKIRSKPEEEGTTVDGFPVRNGKIGIMSGVPVSSQDKQDQALKIAGYNLAHPREGFFEENGMDGPFKLIIGGTPGSFFKSYAGKDRGERLLYPDEFDLVNAGMSIREEDYRQLFSQYSKALSRSDNIPSNEMEYGEFFET